MKPFTDQNNETIFFGRMSAYRMVRNYICAQKALVVTSDDDLAEDASIEAWSAYNAMLRILSEQKERIVRK